MISGLEQCSSKVEKLGVFQSKLQPKGSYQLNVCGINKVNLYQTWIILINMELLEILF